MVVTQMQKKKNYSENSDKLTSSLVWIIFSMSAGILLDVFVTRLLLPKGGIYGSSCREVEKEQETFSSLTLVLSCIGYRWESGRRQ